MRTIWVIIITALLSSMFTVGIYRALEKPKEVIIQAPSPAVYTNYTDELLAGNIQRTFASSSPTNFITGAKKATPGVVNIKSSQGGDYFWESLNASSGSGVLISPDGYIVTNNHVIEEGKSFKITLADHREFDAKLIGSDPSTDLALLKIIGSEFEYLIFGNSDSLNIGEWVLAVGNPFNLESTVTAGIVSAKGRNIDILKDNKYSIESFIQTDAAVNPGNSGGALVNTNGELVGINTAIITRSGKYEGYSFAIPSNLARKIIRDLRDFGVVQRGILGVVIDDVNVKTAKRLKLENVEGVHITDIHSKSGAADAGLQEDDVIIGINNIKIKTLPELQEQIARFRPGNSIEVEYFRNAEKQVATVILKNRGNTTELVNARKGKILEDLGFEVRNLTRAEEKRLTIKGVYVKSIYKNSVIQDTNMELGFIITNVNEDEITSVDDIIRSLQLNRGVITLGGVYDGYDGEYFYEFRK